MATKRKTSSELGVSSGTAAARATTMVTRKHRTPAVNETFESGMAPSSAAVSPEPTFDEVAQLAYSYWEARGYQGGSPEEDWLRAEQQLRSAVNLSAAK